MMNFPTFKEGSEVCDSSRVMAVAVAYDVQKAEMGFAFTLRSRCRNKRKLRMLMSVAKAMIDPINTHSCFCM